MSNPAASSKIDIRPGVKIFSVLKHLNYKPWYAIAEFVDNSIQSFIDCRKAIEAVDGSHSKLRVEIEVDTNDDNGRLVIRDNAGGIRKEDFPRAFRPAAIPPDRSGLSEFGMGMKSAACWFSPIWTVRTSALGEAAQKTVSFDIYRIVDNEVEELDITTQHQDSNTHFTEITLTNLHRIPQTNSVGKIKKHLSSIYREFLRDGTLELRYNGDLLRFDEVAILEEPTWPEATGEPVRWFKRIDFDFGLGLQVHGFAALRAVGSTTEAGFALFRRRRVIEGSADDTYRPSYIFGKPNSFRYQRVFGELHLEGFEVSHTKDGFEWKEHEQPFLELLREELDTPPISLLQQAEAYRPRQKTKDLKRDALNSTERVAYAVEHNAASVIEHQLTIAPDGTPPPQTLTPAEELAAEKTVTIDVFGRKWEVLLQLTNDPAVGEWVSYRVLAEQDDECRKIGIRLSLSHPFMTQLGVTESTQIEPLQRIATALVLSEITARMSGVQHAGTIRRNINQFLAEAFVR